MTFDTTLLAGFFLSNISLFSKKLFLCKNIFLFLHFFLLNHILLSQISDISVSLVPRVFTVAHGEAGVGLHGEITRLAAPVDRGLSCTSNTSPCPPSTC